jgi:pSer/pThr/pTyr-binding forkhead associated (FHA) protein
LLLKRGGVLTGEEFPIGEKVVIGRFHEETGPVDVDLSHLPEGGYVSRHHAEIYQDASGQWFVKDLGSTNGTYLRSSETGQFQRLPANQPIPVKDGDEVVFGNVHFIFRTQG